jgi:uncharacterized protein YcsI (UPF0317 family)
MSWKDNLEAVRQWIRLGQYSGHTAGLAPGYAQANLVMLPKDSALDFLIFCQRNPKACPVLDVLEAGRFAPNIAPGCDLRTDLPKYRVFHNGAMLDEVKELGSYWRDDLVSFLLGCSFTFESRLIAAGFSMRHIEQDSVIPVYETNIACKPAGPFFGPMVVSMRPIPAKRVAEAVQITARLPRAHGAPIHVGAPAAIGIRDINKPDWGKPVEIKDDEAPVFWACGVTSQAVARASLPPFMITHAPGHMFITDLLDAELTEL